jgi:hypothetical protein
LLRAEEYLRRQLGCDAIGDEAPLGLPSVRVSLHDWSHPKATPLAFDRLIGSVQQEGDFCLRLYCADWLVGSHAALELLTRYQRLLPLPAAARMAYAWEAVLEAQRRRLSPERSARGQDAWRWLLRLKGDSSPELQLALLFNQPGESRAERLTLRAARDLSFFSLQSWSHLQKFGARTTRALVVRRLRRMEPEAVCLALTTRQPPAIGEIFEDFLTQPGARLEFPCAASVS